MLVNNAALTYYTPIKDFAPRRWQKMIDVDLTGPFLLVQAVLPDMLAAGRGHILNISSRAAIHPEGPPFDYPMRGGTVYGMVKAGIERFTTGLAAELHQTNTGRRQRPVSHRCRRLARCPLHGLDQGRSDPRADPSPTWPAPRSSWRQAPNTLTGESLTAAAAEGVRTDLGGCRPDDRPSASVIAAPCSYPASPTHSEGVLHAAHRPI